MDYNYLAELLFPNVKQTVADLEEKYPNRDLPEGAKVTRFSPSPTGYVHIGAMYGVLTDERLAHQSGGVFYLRIEDTDAKREIENGVSIICDTFAELGIEFDEGASSEGGRGNYGPYRQRERVEIYHTVAKEFVKLGRAYPCFCTEEELAEMRARQEEQKANFGYYGEWAKYRECPIETVEQLLKEGKPYVLRFRSLGDISRRVKQDDLIRGTLDFPQNDIDHVMLKSDGVPTYHFAHVVDDHFMRTTHVIRGEEWLATLPLHVEMFEAIGWKRPKYGHTAQVMKLDGDSKRKLSKRKDPEADMRFYSQQGYYVPAIKEYLMTLINSNFEEWRIANPNEPFENFKFNIKKAGVSGALFDLLKLDDISKNVISKLSADVVYDNTVAWAEKYDEQLYALLTRDRDYTVSILSIGRGGAKPRKDFAKWSDVRGYLDFFFDELFAPAYDFPENVSKEDAVAVLEKYKTVYDPEDEQTVWFGKIKAIAEELGFAPETKLYKKNPEQYKGHVGDISMVLRVAITGRQNSPDMQMVMSILGKERTVERINAALAELNK
ncbi:MAG: glutamate--tRNA ligase [Oscillospiraceae bacterium]|nr:glutamate--tRNA ligase [Oscillospiraceae bacterium]